MITRWETTEPVGFLPAGVVIELISLSLTGGPNSSRNRDGHVDPGGDGQWLRIRHPHGTLIGMVPADSDVGQAFIAEHSTDERNHQ